MGCEFNDISSEAELNELFTDPGYRVKMADPGLTISKAGSEIEGELMVPRFPARIDLRS